ncbi:ATP-binding protein [Dethiosulfovibrio salsuginis]|uniref:Uncharacterized protein YPO0396 n=1 Tax=Dethiosulfovibrio salsuginis TaxID=561720 RepID=A0A1X7K285_9BACT|nr:ATP-binding protein [Dethiosulfovibrio salsuginis]SMG34911.1 Uncharacterized protein YPO0396 [Dethiosulfovibrio salsuginis]
MSEPIELEFSSEDGLAGFRLHRFEVLNWGTFDGRVWSLNLDGKNCLLTGDIGSGKSTLVDGITTLLVPSHKVAYNKAAGAESKERTLKSYVLGYFKSERRESLGSVKAVSFRDEKSYSVILGVFRNEGYDKTVTLAQVFWTKDPSSQPARLYVACDGELSIAKDFSDFGKDILGLKKRLRSLKVGVFDSFTEYGNWFRRSFGIKDRQALDLFHQTVSMKSVGNLTDFVRDHMIEPFPTESRIEKLIAHFEDLNRAHEAVLKAKRQIEQLEPLVSNWERHGQISMSVQNLRNCREALHPWIASQRIKLLKKRISSLEEEFLRHKGAVTELEDLKNTQKKRERELRLSIAESGGDRVETIGEEIRRLQQELDHRKRRESRYGQLLAILEEVLPSSGEDFLKQRSNLAQIKKRCESSEARINNDLNEIGVPLSREREELKGLTAEIGGLKARRSNIDERQVSIRRSICKALNISEEEMPFVGELIQVREDQRDWEGAAERLLRNFGLSLLVPDSHYRQVEEFVDRTHLKGRLVYFHVREDGRKGQPQIHPDSLVNKLQLKPNSPFYGWLDRELAHRFNLICCDSADRFRKEPMAVTAAGQIKTPGGRHEKDDRFALNDKSRYVLGWSNEEKIAALEEKARGNTLRIAELSRRMDSLNSERSELMNALKALSGLEEYREFGEINWRPLSLSISTLEEERRTLEAASDRLQLLTSQLSELELEMAKTEEKLDQRKDRRSKTEEKISNATTQLREARETLSDTDDGLTKYFTSLEAFQVEATGDKALTVETCETRERALREWLQVKIDGEDKKIARLGESIVKAMTEYRREWPLDTKDVDSDVASGGEFLSMLKGLRSDDLPRFEGRFKELLNENTIREIANFQSQLNRERETIRERIDQINRSLTQIDYNPDRYIRIEAQLSHDVDVRDFQAELRACTEGTLTGSEENQYSDGKFLQVKRIIERFKGRENFSDLDRRWTAKVTDVRNWFVFAASERWRQDDSEHEHYADSGGKSGGQKEKLAYTVLAASLAYRFGLEWGAVRSKSFRFVVIDEAFGRGSDESAQYGLQLFEKLNLQLLVVTPMQKIHIIEPFVSNVGFVQSGEDQRSVLLNMTIQEYRGQKEGTLS